MKESWLDLRRASVTQQGSHSQLKARGKENTLPAPRAPPKELSDHANYELQAQFPKEVRAPIFQT